MHVLLFELLTVQRTRVISLVKHCQIGSILAFLINLCIIFVFYQFRTRMSSTFLVVSCLDGR